MKAAIIAAGEGSRLKGHASAIKPLVPVAGRPLSHWIVDGLRAAGCVELTVLTNSRGGAVAPSLSAAFPTVKFDFVTADTASSFESFRLVSLRLAETEEEFVVSTVDALIRPDDVARFIVECRRAKADAGLALTLHVDDEKPLWADVDRDARVTALGEKAVVRKWVTSGLYYLAPETAARMPEAGRFSRLRDYLSSLAASSEVLGVPLAKTLDVDRAEDVANAEAFITW